MNKKLTKPALAARSATPVFFWWDKKEARVYDLSPPGLEMETDVTCFRDQSELQII
jgi:hypothetical protein